MIALRICIWFAAAIAAQQAAKAQEPPEDSRAGILAKAQAEKAHNLRAYQPSRAEDVVDRATDLLMSGQLRWHPFFESAYRGGGFTLGAGYRRFVSAYDTIDLRGSITFSGYKRAEVEYFKPRLFNRRAMLSVIGGWREAMTVGFYGFGTPNTSKDDRANYSFRQSYASATLEVRPFRRLLALGGGLELTNWAQRPGSGNVPSVEEVYTPTTLPGLGASPTYIHSQGTVAIEWRRPGPGYARSGGYLGVTGHDFADPDDIYSFRRIDYNAVQHIPLLRETWVLSLRGRVETTHTSNDKILPFFMMPSIGGGSDLRGFTSWRFRDRNSLVLSAEWRVIANRFLDMALFYDAGKVTARRSDLDLKGLKSDVGLGFRFHGPAHTPLRLEVARSNEGFAIIFSANPAF